MHYGELKKCDIANGIGVRVTLFVSGCTNRCPDCFQPRRGILTLERNSRRTPRRRYSRSWTSPL